jgi:ABC-type antimicrobial peptide transport system permease subunit
MSGHLELARWPARTLAWLSGICAVVAGVIGLVGLFGVVNRSVSQRVREFGIRAALGAAPLTLLRLVLREGLSLSLPGIALGFTASFAAGRLVGTRLPIATEASPTLWLVVAALELTAVLAACSLPARRAARVDPIAVLRHD